MADEEKTTGKKPDLIAYTSREGSDHKTRIGAAWLVSKGGIAVTLDANPVTGKIILFPSKEEEIDS